MPRIVDTLRAVVDETNDAAMEKGADDRLVALAIEEGADADRLQAVELGADEEADQFLFIEVGGPNKHVDGSPEVLAIPARRPTAQPEKKAPDDMPPAIVDEAEQRAVSFQPWPEVAESDLAEIAPDLIVYHQPEHPVSKQYAALLEQVATSAEGKKALAFTAFDAADIATTTAINLALAANRSGERNVVVVDANWKRPTVAQRLGAFCAPGLHEVLSGSAALEAALQTTRANGLQVLPAGEVEDDASVWTADALHWVMRWLGRRFDLVFVDAGDWGDETAFEIVRVVADAVFPVVSEDSRRQDQLPGAIQQLCDAGANVCGVIYFNPLSQCGHPSGE